MGAGAGLRFQFGDTAEGDYDGKSVGTRTFGRTWTTMQNETRSAQPPAPLAGSAPTKREAGEHLPLHLEFKDWCLVAGSRRASSDSTGSALKREATRRKHREHGLRIQAVAGI